ncbi:MAG: hypothetical protein DHS20C18_33390 [Saprospiraceae bacterium]|nr:MAG: hypothetical protein DHS20C18_33390 [Saprospiraceae bacterium]
MLFSSQIFAQEKMSKEEKKKWKNELKTYKKDLNALKILKEEHAEYRQENRDLEEKLNRLEASQSMGDSRMVQKDEEIAALNNQLMNAQMTIQQLHEQKPDNEMSDKGMLMGLIYRVQIGAYEKTSIPDNLNSDGDLKLEQEDGLQKVVIGQFRDYSKALELQKHIKKIGVKDAWVVPYNDGQRITIEEAKAMGGMKG